MSTAEPGPAVAIEVTDALTEAQASAVLDLADRAARADGVAPLSEDGLLHVRYGGGAGRRDLLLRSGGRLAGYARLDPATPGHEDSGPVAHTAELVIDPDVRRRGLGRALADALAATAAGPLRVWAHGDLAGA